MRIEDPKLNAALADWGVEVRSNECLGKWTSLGVGGTTDVLMVRDGAVLPELFSRLRDDGVVWRLLGGGSNLLVQEGELPWVALHLAGHDSPPVIEGARVTVPAAADLGRTVTTLARKNLGGLEGLIGVPGSVGGALRMNAGAYGTEIGRFVQLVTLYRAESNQVETLTANEAGFQYRSTAFGRDDVVLSAEMVFPERPYDDIRAEIRAFNDKRRRSQPVQEKSAGCIFKNPPGASTGKMIDELGLKGHRIGGAVVSERHANFFVNRYNATADDLYALADFVKEKVQGEFGCELEEEVIFWKD